jgi:cytoskeletal protein CcmA (bactofilin family)
MRFKHSVASLLLLMTSSVQASEFILTNNYAVTAEQTMASEQWVAATTVTAAGTFKDDLFAASSSELQLPGTYEGNLWAGAGTDARLSGTCRRNARLMAPTLRITGSIDGNLIAVANTISIATNTVISGNARLIGSQIIVEGTILGSLSLSSMRTTTLSGHVQGNASITAPEIILSNEVRIDGNLSYTTDRELIPATDSIGGKLKRIAPESPYSAARIRKHVIAFFAAMLTAIPFITLFPMTTAMASLLARKSPLKCLLVGFAAVGALPVLALVCISSSIGFPLGAVLLASWGILVYTSRIVVGLMIGTLVLKWGKRNPGRILLAAFAGLAIIYSLTLLPAPIGGVAQLLVVWSGMGALLLALLQKRRLIIQVPEELKQIETLKSEQNTSPEENP